MAVYLQCVAAKPGQPGAWVGERTLGRKKYLQAYPKATMIVGASTYRSYDNDGPHSETAHQFKDSKNYYDAFNTALQIDKRDSIQVYHKSRLVPGVEIMPYHTVFGFLEKLTIDLGGTSGSLGIQNERTNFISPVGTKIAPAICYESIYGGFMSAYIRNGAQLIFVITNDGWWGNTPGFRQHMNYARLLAIEFRKSIARSANTGISCFINQRGDVIQHTGWWVEDAIRQTDKNGGRVQAVLNNLTIGILRKLGWENIAKARRYFNARIEEALNLILKPLSLLL